MLHRARDLLIKQRTMTINALRAHLAELGLVSPRGRDGVAALITLVESDEGTGILDDRSGSALMALVTHLRGVQTEIRELDLQIANWHRDDAVSQRLATIPGIGVMTATALSATLGDGSAFHSARQLAAWLGLVPRQTSSGGKDRLGRITRDCQEFCV